MGDNLVIAAIPDENDRVWKVSSEKIPHLTLLFLGETSKVANLEQIMLFVEHAASQSLNRFYLPVDRRGELGDDKADVLFFKKGRYDFKAICNFRNMLLQDQNIKTAYDSATQFAGPWTPHLTLGYSATPAKPVDDDHSFYDVQFNKIAVWAGDFEGPDFLLKDYWEEMEENGYDMDAPVGAMAIHELSHFGVKGMRWGSRKSETISVDGKPKQVTPKKAAKADKAWEKNIFSISGAIDVHNATADHFNQRIGAINDKHDVRFTEAHWADASQKSWSPEQKAYLTDVNKMEMEGTRKAVLKVHGKSPTGKLSARLSDDGSRIVVEHKANVNDLVWKSPGSGTSGFGHADTSDETTEILASLKLIFNDNGQIIGVGSIQPKEGDTMSQTSDLGIEFLEHCGVKVDTLEHFGTKGMRWGVRNDTSNGAAGNAVKKVGSGVKKTVNFGKDVNFESRTTPKQDGSSSRAKNKVIRAAKKDFAKKDLTAINAKPEHVQAKKLKNRLRNPLDPQTKAYRSEVKAAYLKRLETTANSMTNTKGTRQYTIRERHIDLPAQGGNLPQSKWAFEVTARNVEHAALDENTTLVEMIMDGDGFVIDSSPIEDPKEIALAQSAVELGETALSSLGINLGG